VGIASKRDIALYLCLTRIARRGLATLTEKLSLSCKREGEKGGEVDQY